MESEAKYQIDVTPDQSLMPKLGSAGYSAPQAIAELVDNSIDAILDGEKLLVSIKISKDEIVVADNARGMEKRAISNAMKLAHSEKRGKLGQFGLGLKTACFSLGRLFEIKTSAAGSLFEYRVVIDEDRWLREEEHWKVGLHEEPADSSDHFTIVRVAKLRNSYPGLKELVFDDLGRRYSPYLTNGDVEIKVNGKACKGVNFDLAEDTRKEFEVFTRGGARVWGWCGLLKQGSNRGFYGFNTYRLGRMITTFDKIGIREHPTISRIVGEVHLDHVPVTHNKREFIRESAEYREAEQLLRKEFEEIVRLARQRASQDTVTKTVKAELEKIKDAITDVLRKSEFKPFTDFLVGPAETKPDPLGKPEKVPVEQREQNGSPEPPQPAPPPPESPETKERKPNKTHEKLRQSIRIHGKSVNFEHQFAPLGVNESWKRWHFDPAKGLDIYTNIEFPAYLVTRDKSFYAILHIAESIAELWVRESRDGSERIDELKELILRRVSETLEDWVGHSSDDQP